MEEEVSGESILLSQNSEQNKRQTHTHIPSRMHIMPGSLQTGEGGGWEAVWVTDTSAQMQCVVCGKRHRRNTLLHTCVCTQTKLTHGFCLANKPT